MIDPQSRRAFEAARVVRWLRECSREMFAEGDPGGAVEIVRLAVTIGRVFGASRPAPAVATDERPEVAAADDDEVTIRWTYAGQVPEEKMP